MKLNKLSLLGFAIFSLLFSNCSKNEDSTILETNAKFDLGKTVGRAFKGTVVDQNNNALSNVTVTMNGKTATTDSNGVFTFSNISVKERFAYMVAEKAGFFNGSRTMMTHDGLNTLKIMMVPAAVTKTIQTGVVSTVALGNTSVKFDGSFSTESGQAYTGAVKVYMMDMPANDPNVFSKMPGSLLAIDAQGDYKGLETFGMVNVELKGSNNQKLQLTAGHPAQITMNIAPGKLEVSPARIPMWFFDEVVGVWKEEGFSNKLGNKYVGNVAHFTPWNNDWAFTVAQLIVTATNDDGTPVNNVRCEIFRPSVTATPDHWNVPLINLGVTSANGTLSAGVPINEVFIFRAYDPNTGELISEQPLAASSDMVRNVSVVLGSINRPSGN
jgi:hypothetical protein